MKGDPARVHAAEGRITALTGSLRGSRVRANVVCRPSLPRFLDSTDAYLSGWYVSVVSGCISDSVSRAQKRANESNTHSAVSPIAMSTMRA